MTDMEQQNKIDRLEAENHELLALIKQAFVKREVEREPVPVDEEWQKFATEHADELEALDKDEPRATAAKTLMGIMPYKVAASIIGILFTAGVAFAAIHIVQKMAGGDMESPAQEVQTSRPSQQPLPADTVRTDTTATVQPVVFDNVPLEEMLPQIAAYYKKEVEFVNADARLLRFYLVWKQDEPLDAVLHRLNLFESITVELKSEKIIVE